MAFKRLLILGGAALLVAGCGTDITSPAARVQNVPSAVRNANAANPKKKDPGAGGIMSMQASDSASCRSGWPITVGIIGDSTCTGEP